MPTPHPDHRAVTPYTRADAITDALLFEVPQRLARQFRFPYPVAVTAVAWFDAVAWDARAEAGKPRPTYQTESGRISDLLWAARQAVNTTTTGSHDLEFVIYRVPPTGPHTRALRLTLVPRTPHAVSGRFLDVRASVSPTPSIFKLNRSHHQRTLIAIR